VSRGVTAGLFNILRSFLALFAGRRRKNVSRVDAASATEATANAMDSAATMADEATGTDAAAAMTDMAPVTTDAAAAITGAATTATATTAGIGRTGKLQRAKMSSGFDMQAEIAKLAERIIEPVAAKLTEQDLEHVIGRIRDTFEQLNFKRAAAAPSFENMAVNILEPVQPSLTDAESRRAVDRLSGAMAAFCQAPGQSAA